MKKTFYFPHDYHARHDPKLEVLFLKLGYEGIGIYWCIIEMLYEQGGYLSVNDILLRGNGDSGLCQRIAKVLRDFCLFKIDGDKVWSETCLNRLNSMNERSEKAKISARKRWGNANAMPTHSEGNAIKDIKDIENTTTTGKKEVEKDAKDLVLTAWNERMPWKVRTLTGTRLRHLTNRLKEKDFVDNFHTILTKILESDFLMGRRVSENHPNFKADFDWLIKNDNNYIKILEDKYANRGSV